MDSIGGAKILSERLLQNEGEELVPDVRPVVSADALPLFHWTGVEPAAPAEPPRPRPRWRRSR
jgi:hypothetical protein